MKAGPRVIVGECEIVPGRAGRYPHTLYNGKQTTLPRATYLRAHGEHSADGLTIDHLCHNADPTCRGGSWCMHRRCIRLDHLEAVDRGENVRRGFAARLTCVHGHPKAGNRVARPNGTTYCAVCAREQNRGRWLAIAANRERRAAYNEYQRVMRRRRLGIA